VGTMTSKERVLGVINRKPVDRVPWIETTVDDTLASKIVGRNVKTPKGGRMASEIYDHLLLDNVTCTIRPPRLANVDTSSVGKTFLGERKLKTPEDLKKLKQLLPDPDDDKLYQDAIQYLKEHKKDKAAIAQVSLGISDTYNSMGIDYFSLCLYDDPNFVMEILDTYIDWSIKVVENLNELDFDLYLTPEDVAFKSGPLFSPKMFREMFAPRVKRLIEKMELPWIYHTDGDITNIIEELIPLGMSAICNLEPTGNMDIYELKKKYGDRICLMGNIDLHHTLTLGTVEETTREVYERITRLAPGGGYILSSSNSLPVYCKPENVMAMSKALEKYGHYIPGTYSLKE
jgi:uroporphyrinogen decarboxylase